MGCDIHFFTEYKRVIGGQPKWVSMDYFKHNPYFSSEESDDEGPEFDVVPLFGRRDYRLFSLLAGVRNYSKIKPISEPRGMPLNACHIIEKECARWDGDGHSHSFFTLYELKEAQKTHKTTRYSGYVHPDDVLLINQGGMPDIWCQSASEKSWVYMEWERENDPLKEIIELLDARKSEFLWIKQDDDTKDKDVRFVFWFDN